MTDETDEVTVVALMTYGRRVVDVNELVVLLLLDRPTAADGGRRVLLTSLWSRGRSAWWSLVGERGENYNKYWDEWKVERLRNGMSGK